MHLITFDPFRTLGIPGVRYIKPELYLDHLAEIRAAHWLLFPEYWQVNALIYAHRKRIFPSASSYHLGHDKVEMTRALESRFPQHLPVTLIRPSTQRDAEDIVETRTTRQRRQTSEALAGSVSRPAGNRVRSRRRGRYDAPFGCRRAVPRRCPDPCPTVPRCHHAPPTPGS